MARPVSSEKRADIIRHMEAGKSQSEIAEWLFVCVHTVSRVWTKYKRSGSPEPEPQNSGRKPLVSDEVMGRVVSKIKEVPDMTLFELIEEFDLPISKAALSKRLIRLGFTYKKKLSIRLQESEKTSLRQGRHGG
jgi:transposase